MGCSHLHGGAPWLVSTGVACGGVGGWGSMCTGTRKEPERGGAGGRGGAQQQLVGGGGVSLPSCPGSPDCLFLPFSFSLFFPRPSHSSPPPFLGPQSSLYALSLACSPASLGATSLGSLSLASSGFPAITPPPRPPPSDWLPPPLSSPSLPAPSSLPLSLSPSFLHPSLSSHIPQPERGPHFPLPGPTGSASRPPLGPPPSCRLPGREPRACNGNNTSFMKRSPPPPAWKSYISEALISPGIAGPRALPHPGARRPGGTCRAEGVIPGVAGSHRSGPRALQLGPSHPHPQSPGL